MQQTTAMLRPSSANLRVSLTLLLVTGFIAGLTLPSIALTRDRQVVHAAPQSASALDVIINEVAWAGTEAALADEWIELYNPTGTTIDLTGWRLTDGGDIDVTFTGSIQPDGYFLLEAGVTLTDDSSISDIDADQIYIGDLSNSGEILTLYDSEAIPNIIDTANATGSAWTAGGSVEHYSMERTGVVADSPTSWVNNNGITRYGSDAAGNPINGTPRNDNSAVNPYPTLTLQINEVAWGGTLASADDEWIELYNPGISDIHLDGWRLAADDGTPDIAFLSPKIIPAGGYFLLERARQQVTDVSYDQLFSGSLEDGGEVLRLRAPDGTVIDTANGDGGKWPAGCPLSANTTYPECDKTAEFTGSMERMDVIDDETSAWVTNVNSLTWTHYDAGNNLIHGTPKEENWDFGIITHTPTPMPATPLSLLINEVAWMGTVDSSNDEWIELYNPGSQTVDLSGWRLSSTDNTPNIIFTGSICVPDCNILAGGYFVIAANEEVFDDDVITHVPLIPDYTASLSLNNEGEVLRLYDPSGAIVDTANSDGGAWPAGVGSPTYASMERRGVQADGFFAWSTYSNPANSETPAPPPYPDPVVYDHHGNLIKGTPGQANWGLSVTQTPTFTATPPRTATPTRTPTKRPTATAYLSRLVLINEFLPRPGSDWNHDGQINVYDEFIEIINADSVDINLKGWQLDDAANAGSDAFILPDKVLKPGQRAVYYGLQSNILLSDGGDTVRLIRSNGEVADVQEYKFARFADVSECQYPEGPGYFGVWRQDCFPTPGTANKLTGDLPPAPEGLGALEPTCMLPDTLLEAFKLAECNGYGGNMWNAWYWDKNGWGPGKNVEQYNNQWGAWVD